MATVPMIDDVTADAIRRALSAAAAGQIDRACEIGERALAEGGDKAPLHAMLGMLRTRAGDLPSAVDHLRLAYESRPSDPVIVGNLAAALSQLGEHREALDLLTDEILACDRTGRLLKIRAFSAQMAEDFAAAITSYEEVVVISPDDWEAWNNLGNARRLAGDFDGSVEALRRAMEIEPAAAPIWLNLANALTAAGKFEEGEQHLRKMAEEFPEDSKPLRELHALLKQQLRDEEALQAIESAVAREPDDLELWLALASHRLTLLRHSDAEEAYREVLDRDPSNSLANLGLGVVFEVTNRTEDLSNLVREAEERGAARDTMSFIRAFDHRRNKRFKEGLEALAHVPIDLESARRAHLLGQLEEGAGNYDEAFAAYERMNELRREDPSQPELRAANYRAMIRNQTAALSDEWRRSWQDRPIDDRPAPAFLVGFPRSGTTLLDTILMSHPDIEVMEEEPTLRAASALLPFEQLPSATAEQVAAARDSYFQVAESRVPLRPGTLLVDKNPLSSNAIPLIRRMFPDARIILALRHPCDVVLSCVVTNFKLNDGMANFLSLETAAELYDLTLTYFEKAQLLLNLPQHNVVYENIVDDRESELRPLLDFLGVDWRDAVLDHQSTARGRGHIKTASYAQVVEPIYQRSAGRWRNFRKHLEPVIPVLRPWIDKFGYEI